MPSPPLPAGDAFSICRAVPDRFTLPPGGAEPGVFYSSKTSTTAVAEMAFHRLLFFADSPGTPWPADAGDYTAFWVQFPDVGRTD